jgi:hypothetical protein
MLVRCRRGPLARSFFPLRFATQVLPGSVRLERGVVLERYRG